MSHARYIKSKMEYPHSHSVQEESSSNMPLADIEALFWESKFAITKEIIMNIPWTWSNLYL